MIFYDLILMAFEETERISWGKGTGFLRGSVFSPPSDYDSVIFLVPQPIVNELIKACKVLRVVTCVFYKTYTVSIIADDRLKGHSGEKIYPFPIF